MTTPTRALRGRPETRARLLDAARELFTERGVEGTSLRAIALRAGLSGPAIYYYFENRLALMHALGNASELDQDTVERPPPASIEEALRVMVEGTASRVQRQHILHGTLTLAALDGQPEAIAARAANYDRAAAHNRRLLERFVGPDDLEAAADLATLILLGMITAARIEHGPRLPEHLGSDEFRNRALASLLVALGRYEGAKLA